MDASPVVGLGPKCDVSSVPGVPGGHHCGHEDPGGTLGGGVVPESEPGIVLTDRRVLPFRC